MEIREVSAAERASVSLPVQACAFQPTPASEELVKALERRQRYQRFGYVGLPAIRTVAFPAARLRAPFPRQRPYRYARF